MEVKIIEPGHKNESTQATLELLYNISREIAAAIDLHTLEHRAQVLCSGNVPAYVRELLKHAGHA